MWRRLATRVEAQNAAAGRFGVRRGETRRVARTNAVDNNEQKKATQQAGRSTCPVSFGAAVCMFVLRFDVVGVSQEICGHRPSSLSSSRARRALASQPMATTATTARQRRRRGRRSLATATKRQRSAPQCRSGSRFCVSRRRRRHRRRSRRRHLRRSNPLAVAPPPTTTTTTTIVPLIVGGGGCDAMRRARATLKPSPSKPSAVPNICRVACKSASDGADNEKRKAPPSNFLRARACCRRHLE